MSLPLMLPQSDAEVHLNRWQRDGIATASGSAVFPVDLPVFAGHFPGRPVVPGVYVVGTMLALLRRVLDRPALALTGIQRVKWPRVSLPGDRLEVAVAWEIREDGSYQVDGTVTNGGVVACRCRFTVA